MTGIISKIIYSLVYIVISFVISAYFMLFVCSMVRMLRPKEVKEKKKELQKKNSNRRLNETNKNTEQRIQLSKTGVCFLLGNYDLSPAVYSLGMRPLCGILCMVVYLLITHKFSLVMIPLFVIGDIGFDIFIKEIGKNQERQIEWDIYKALTNVRIQLTTGSYLEDSLRMVAESAIHPRFAESMEELIKNINDKSKTTSESIAILKTRFSSERVMNFCKILETFITYGPVDNVFKDMEEELKSMITASSERTANDIRHRYSFTAGWMSMIVVIIALMFFDMKFSDNEIVNEGIISLILGLEHMFGI